MTLVELMISMLLAAILSAGLFYMTSGQQRVYTSQLDTMQLQEGLWGAMEYVKRQVRLAGRGFGGCLRGRVYDGDPDVPQNAVIYGLRVFNGCNLSTDPVLDNSSLVDRCATSNSSHSDSFAVTMRDTRDNPPLQVMRSGAAKQMDLAVVNTLGFLPGDQVIVYPFGDSMRPCVLREITGTSPPVPPSLYPLLNTKSPNGRGDPTIGYPVGSLVIDVGSVSSPLTPAVPLAPRYFAIDHSKNYPRLITWLGTSLTNASAPLAAGTYEIVAEGIEDMQIAWTCDANVDGTLAEGQTPSARISDEWAYNVPGDTVPDCGWHTPVAMRITLIARSRSADLRYKLGFRPAAEDRAAGTSADDQTLSGTKGTFRRRVLTAVIRPQNMRQH